MTVYKAIKPQAEDAAEYRRGARAGQDSRPTRTRPVNNGTEDVPTHHLRPGRRDRRTTSRTRRGGRLLDRRRDLHRRVQGRLHGSRHPVAQRLGPDGDRPSGGPGRTSMARSRSRAEGRDQALRRRGGADRRGLRGRRRRGRRPRRRQRRRQVHARSRRSPGVSPATRASSCSTGEPVTHQRARRTPTDLGIATVYQDLALCDNLDVVANLYLGRGDATSPGRGRWLRLLDEIAMEKQAVELLELAVGRASRACDTEVASLSGGQRQIGGDRALAARRAEARDARRADRRARRGADAQVLDLILRLQASAASAWS